MSLSVQVVAHLGILKFWSPDQVSFLTLLSAWNHVYCMSCPLLQARATHHHPFPLWWDLSLLKCESKQILPWFTSERFFFRATIKMTRIFLRESKTTYLAMCWDKQRKWHLTVQTIYSHVYCSNSHSSQETGTPVCPLIKRKR